MKTLTVLTAAVLMAGMTAAAAQGTSRQMDEQAGGNSQAVERILAVWRFQNESVP